MGVQCWVTGLRCTEGRTRTDFQEVEERDKGLFKLNPILVWHEREVWQYLALYQVPVNPLYAKGPLPRLRAVHADHHGARRACGPLAGHKQVRRRVRHPHPAAEGGLPDLSTRAVSAGLERASRGVRDL
jgi:3'-phosphoadenosine 5'-phosphosulfate sulfotransferase (PAPS reductase)/FAD synthetase